MKYIARIYGTNSSHMYPREKEKTCNSITEVIEFIGKYLEYGILEILDYNITVSRIFDPYQPIAEISNRSNRFDRGKNYFDVNDANEEEMYLFLCLYLNGRMRNRSVLLAAKAKGWL